MQLAGGNDGLVWYWFGHERRTAFFPVADQLVEHAIAGHENKHAVRNNLRDGLKGLDDAVLESGSVGVLKRGLESVVAR